MSRLFDNEKRIEATVIARLDHSGSIECAIVPTETDALLTRGEGVIACRTSFKEAVFKQLMADYESYNEVFYEERRTHPFRRRVFMILEEHRKRNFSEIINNGLGNEIGEICSS